MEETQKEKQAVPEPIDIITLLHDVLRGVKKLWWACLLLTVLCAAGSWYTAKRAYRPLYRAAASFTVATGSGESGGFSYGFYYNTATASQLARTFPYILESELLTDGIKQALGTDSITASLSASAVEDSNLFTLTATGANAESALNVLNAAIDCYPEAARYVLGDIKLHMLSAPSLPTTPYNIFDGKRAALTGAAYGLLFGAGLILLYGCTRRTVRREEEIASKLHLLCLGTLPKVVFKKRSKSRRETLTLTNSHVPEHYREAARGLAMRLERRMAASGDKVLLFCGTLPGEGVRTTAMTAAHVLGEMGKSVVLIDLDLKRGMDKRSPGLEACLLGHCPVQEVLHRRGAEPYRYAACSRGLSPREVLAVGENLRGAIASLREDADCVLLIAPESARSARGGKLRCGGVRHRAGSRIADEDQSGHRKAPKLRCDRCGLRAERRTGGAFRLRLRQVRLWLRIRKIRSLRALRLRPLQRAPHTGGDGMSYIDLHAHVLPGVDDGAETLEASLMMLRMASEHGTKALAVTPHGAWVTKTRYLGKFERLKAAAARESLPVKLFFGMEMMADGTLFDRLQSGDVQPLGESRFLLVEFDPLDSSEWCAAATEHIRKYGYVPLIAHPERYVILQNEPWRAELWTERGAVLQVTRSGIFGAFGRRAAETARVLLERDLAFCVASDGHGTVYRRPILEDVNAWLAEHFGAAYAERMLHENPRRILSGEAGKERIA